METEFQFVSCLPTMNLSTGLHPPRVSTFLGLHKEFAYGPASVLPDHLHPGL